MTSTIACRSFFFHRNLIITYETMRQSSLIAHYGDPITTAGDVLLSIARIESIEAEMAEKES
jgi:hypothetical protein